MANRRNRRLVRQLLDRGPTQLELDSLVEVLAGVGESDDGDRRDRIAIDLHHCRLPQLSAAGILDYDAHSKTVQYRPSGWEARVLRELIEWEQWL